MELWEALAVANNWELETAQATGPTQTNRLRYHRAKGIPTSYAIRRRLEKQFNYLIYMLF